MSDASLNHFEGRLHVEDPKLQVRGGSLREGDSPLGVLNHGFKILFSRALTCVCATVLAV